MRGALLVALVLVARDGILPSPRLEHRITPLPIAPGAGNNTLYFGINQPARIPVPPVHFGLHADRGLPIAEIPAGLAQIIVGAPPKIYRSAVVLSHIGLVWSNFFPTWMPKELYGQWWYIEDWRANRRGDHLEVTNGVEFIECTASVAGTPAEQLGSSYWCPENPDLKIVHQGLVNNLVIYYPNGARNFFAKDTGAGTLEGRYALTEMARKAASGGDGEGYVAVRTFNRTYINRQGNITSVHFPDQRITRIDVWKPAPGSSGATSIVSRIILQYRDLNVESRDCNPGGATVTPQCGFNSFDKCYDEKCSAERQPTKAQECYAAFCNWIPTWGQLWLTESECRPALCGSDPDPNGCWSDKCNRPVEGDPKLWRILMPQAVAPPAERPLIYTLHYNVSSMNAYTQTSYYTYEREPRNKFLDHIEDNRVSIGAGASFVAPRPHHGNNMQFGYDRLNLPADNLFLKSFSFEAGDDVQAVKLEFQDYGLLQRVWTDRQQPFAIIYSTPPSVPTRVQFRDPFGLIVEKTYEPIGLVPTGPCDPSEGCNVQWGLKQQISAEGGLSSYTYNPIGKLETATGIDGTLTTYHLDANGKAESVSKGTPSQPDCISETYGYNAASSFPNTPRSVTTTVAGQSTTSTFTLCEGANCPGFELGSVLSTSVQYPAPGGRMTETTTHTVEAGGTVRSRTTIGDGTNVQVVSDMLAREPVLGLPQSSSTPHGRSARTMAALSPSQANTATGNPGAGTANQNCDQDTQFCEGAHQVQDQQDVEARPYPVQMDPDITAAAAALNMTAFAAADIPRRRTTAVSTGGQPSSSTGDTSNSTTYDINNGTGMPEASSTTRNGVTLRATTEWMKVPTAFGGPRNHPTAKLAERSWAKVGNGAEVFRGGTWRAYSKQQFTDTFPNAGFALAIPPDLDGTASTDMGSLALGHFKADGNPSYPDATQLEDPRVERLSVVGCSDYVQQERNNLCLFDSDCPCGFCLYGQCANGYGNGQFICRQEYLRDPKLVADRNNLSPQLYNSWWWRNNCTVPTCPSTFSTLYCRNPKPL